MRVEIGSGLFIFACWVFMFTVSRGVKARNFVRGAWG